MCGKIAKISGYILLASIAEACATAKYREYKTFTIQIVSRRQEYTLLEKALFNSLRDKLQARGYKYVDFEHQADLKVIVDYKTSIKQYHYLKLEASLSVYKLRTSAPLWYSSTTNVVPYLNELDRLIELTSYQLVQKFPYAPDYGGIGVMVGGDLRIAGFSAVSPARQAGLQKNDLILKVNQKVVTDRQECLTLMRGRVGTTVQLTVLRNNKEYSYNISRLPLQELLQASASAKVESKFNPNEFRKKLLSPQ